MSAVPPPVRRSSRVSFSGAGPTSPISPNLNSPPNPRRSNFLPTLGSQATFTSPAIVEQGDLEKGLSTVDSDGPPSYDVDSRPSIRPLQNAASQPHTPSGLPQNIPSNLDQYGDFWNAYNDEADQEDAEVIKGYGGDLDTLLIFAGLFSATNTAFIIESYKDLKEDASEITNQLLRSLIRNLRNPSFDESELEIHVNTPNRAVRVNTFFFLSLSCSLFAAFGAVIGKQWLNHYEREGQRRAPSARGMERQRKYMGLSQWKFQAVVETLPTLLQFSLFFFFIGLIDFLWPLNRIVSVVVLVMSVATIAFWIATLLIGIYHPNSPFQTRLTALLRKRIVQPNQNPDTEEKKRNEDILMARCVDWLKERTTTSSTIGVVARAVVLLTDDAKKVINLDHAAAMLAYLLRSSVYNGRVYLGISPEGLQSSLIVLQDLIVKWDKYTDIVHPQDVRNAQFLQALRRELWNILTKPGSQTMDATSTNIALDILDKLGAPKQGETNHAEYLISSFHSKTLRRADQLLRLNLLHDAVRSQSHLVVRNYIPTATHMAEILAFTMWSPDKAPDLDPRRVALRLSWFLDDFDTMYPHVQNLNFSQYLSRWRSSTEQPDPLIAFGPAVLTKLYLRSIISLLTKDQERWAKDLDRDGHLDHLLSVSKDMLASDTQLLCWISFLLLANIAGDNEDMNAPPSLYYSEEWVTLVLRILNTDALPWISIPREVFYKPTHTTLLIKALYGYLQTAKRYGRISPENASEAFEVFKTLKDRMELNRWTDQLNFAWVRDVDPLYEELKRERETEMEREASQSIPQIPVEPEQEMAPELDYLVDGLELIKNGEKRAAPSDADKLLSLLQNGSIDKSFQLIGLDFLAYVFMALPKSDVQRIVANHSSSAHIPHLLLFTMWQIDPAEFDPRTLDSDVRQGIVDQSEPRLDLRRIWLGQSPRGVHIDFQEAWFTEYLTSWYELYPRQSKSYLQTVIMLVDSFPDIWLSTLEQDGHVKRIATLVGTSPTPGPNASKVRAAQWIALRLFLAMWHHRAETPEAEDAVEFYITRHAHKAVSTFFSSVKTQSRIIEMDAALQAQDILPKSMNAMEFIKSGSSYLEAIGKKQKLDPAVIEGFELCADPVLCGASKMDKYTGELDWRQDIALSMEKVAKLRVAS